MGAPTSGNRSGLDTETTLLWVVIAVVVAGVGSITGAVHIGSMLSHDGQELPANPFELVFSLISHKVTWPPTATGVLIGFGVLAGVLDGSALVILIAIYMVWDGASESIYSLATAHAGDRASRSEMVQLQSTLLFAWSLSGFVST